VHNGDLNGEKDVHHINAVAEVTQWEITAAVKKMAESYLVPLLESMLNGSPCIIQGFHSDNGSKFVNKNGSKVPQQTLK